MRIVALVERAWLGVTPAGGAERMMHSLMTYLSASGWEVIGAIAHGLPVDRWVDGVHVICPSTKAQLHDLVKSADVVITHLGGTPQARGMAANYGIPLVQLIHNTSEYTVGFLGDGCDLAVYNSEWVKDVHESHKTSPIITSWQNRHMAKIRHRRCFDWPWIVVHPPVLDSDPGSGRGAPGYITLMNLVPNKGPDVFYKLAARRPEWPFLAVIGGYEQQNQVIQDLPNVAISNHAMDVDEVYSKSSIVLMPSKYESYGLVAVEAIGRGIPAIVSDGPGLREAMGSSGIFCDREDLDSWEVAIQDVLADYESASSAARARYRQLYNQSMQELPDFELRIRKLVEEWRS